MTFMAKAKFRSALVPRTLRTYENLAKIYGFFSLQITRVIEFIVTVLSFFVYALS